MIATDGLDSYAIFTYKCGELNWLRSNYATIGFSITQDFYANHYLSITANVNNISCLNSPNSEWSSVVYHIGLRGEVSNNFIMIRQLVYPQLCQSQF